MPRLDPSLIRGFDLFSMLDEHDLGALVYEAAARRVVRGATLFEQGAPAHEAFVVLDGRLKIVQVTPEGEQVVMRFIGAGEPCGMAVMLRSHDYPATAITVIDSLVLAWESECWRDFSLRMPTLALNTFRAIGQRLQDAHSRIREHATEDEERRVAHALLRLAGQCGHKTGSGILVDFPVTRRDIAQMTSLTLDAVSRILSAWESKGLVQARRRRILLRDPHKLLLLAEGDRSSG